MATPSQVVKDALELPREVREELLRALLESLDAPGEDEGHEAAWTAEIERRANDDDTAFVEGADALRRLRADLADP
ncbi:MAG: addiction module protein [Deltaproteobacteria bacterium]|nr:addiction module protein [Deltaproteobacteria bacterium]